MKNFLIFIIGAIFGITLYVIAVTYSAGSISMETTSMNNPENPIDSTTSLKGITMLPELGECVSTNPFKVEEVLESGDAIAREQEWSYNMYISSSLTVLLLNEDGKYYYDDQIIKLPAGKCFKQVGIYKNKPYNTRTYPAVRIMDK